MQLKRLFVCCDGTWNQQNQREFGLLAPTNVVKFANAIQRGVVTGPEQEAIEQLVYYHPGVGAGGGLLDSVLGGAFGIGLRRNIKSAYKWLCDQYSQGDEIYILGFSRGAYTARSLVGMIAHGGLMPGASWDEVETVFKHYQQRRQRTAGVATSAKQRFAEFCQQWQGQQGACQQPIRASIRFVGVWDTVGTLGIPQAGNLARFIEWLNPRWSYRFYDVGLSQLVQTARHALAIDEQRQPFTATLWELPPNEAGRDVIQAWFPGCHADVGGGFAACELADLTLEWMLQEAAQCGAVLSQSMLIQAQHGDFQGPMHDPMTLVYNFMGARPRPTPPLISPDALMRPAKYGQIIHPRALARVKSPPLNDAPYRDSYYPKAGDQYQFEIYARQYWNAPGIYVEAGETYRITAQGLWQKGSVTVDPAGRVPQSMKSTKRAWWLKAKTACWRLCRWPFSWVRRAPTAPWLSLMATVCAYPESSTTNSSNDILPYPTYRVGAGGLLQPAQSGYLYFWANDATGFYGNHRGGVAVTLEKLGTPVAAIPVCPRLNGAEPGFWTLVWRWAISTLLMAAGSWLAVEILLLGIQIGQSYAGLSNIISALRTVSLPSGVHQLVQVYREHPLLSWWGAWAAGISLYSYLFTRADTRVHAVPVRVIASTLE
ncbi:DUF2235 domain-containing protein [Parvibium lacunae]|nr:DUF2235 domain-containing protein [Parvibium lacunae]